MTTRRSGVTVSPAGTGDSERLSGLARKFRFSPRRALGLIGEDVLNSIADQEVTRALGAPIALVGESEGVASAFTSVSPDAWLTEQLGIAVGRVGTLLADGPDSEIRFATRAVLSEAADRARQAGLELLTLRIAAVDTQTLSAARELGYEVVGEEPVYTAWNGSPTAPDPADSHVRDGLSISLHHPGTPLPLNEYERSGLLAKAQQFRGSHLGLDNAIPPGATARVYRRWTENVIDGKLGDVVAIARWRGQAVGFFAGSRDEIVWTNHSVDLVNQIWSVVAHEAIGAFSAMASAVFNREGSAPCWIECETQATNVAVNRAMTRITGGDPATTCLALHYWL